jgi:two-component system NarL family response regulator
MSIRVLCVDDHPVVREGLRALLGREPDIEVVAVAESGEQGIALFEQHKPDITVLDLRLPGIGGVETITAIRRTSPTARIIILTTFASEEEIFLALQAGAVSYVLKDTLADDLVRVVREVKAGGRPIPSGVAARLAARIAQPALTPREVEVLRLVAKGLRNKEIAGELHISEETAQVHVRNIISKLGVHDRTEAVTVGLRRGILSLD